MRRAPLVLRAPRRALRRGRSVRPLRVPRRGRCGFRFGARCVVAERARARRHAPPRALHGVDVHRGPESARRAAGASSFASARNAVLVSTMNASRPPRSVATRRAHRRRRTRAGERRYPVTRVAPERSKPRHHRGLSETFASSCSSGASRRRRFIVLSSNTSTASASTAALNTPPDRRTASAQLEHLVDVLDGDELQLLANEIGDVGEVALVVLRDDDHLGIRSMRGQRLPPADRHHALRNVISPVIATSCRTATPSTPTPTTSRSSRRRSGRSFASALRARGCARRSGS